MSAITETLRQPGRLSSTVSDWWVLTWRNLLKCRQWSMQC